MVREGNVGELDPEPPSPPQPRNTAGSRKYRMYLPLRGFHRDRDVERLSIGRSVEKRHSKFQTPVRDVRKAIVRERLAERRPFRSLRFPQSNFEKWVGSFLHSISRNIAHREAFLFEGILRNSLRTWWGRN